MSHWPHNVQKDTTLKRPSKPLPALQANLPYLPLSARQPHANFVTTDVVGLFMYLTVRGKSQLVASKCMGSSCHYHIQDTSTCIHANDVFTICVDYSQEVECKSDFSFFGLPWVRTLNRLSYHSQINHFPCGSCTFNYKTQRPYCRTNETPVSSTAAIQNILVDGVNTMAQHHTSMESRAVVSAALSRVCKVSLLYVYK